MKKELHPKYNEVSYICNTCKTEYRIGSTNTDDIKVELCMNCHPFYTGKETLVDTDNLVEKFNKKRELAKNIVAVSKKEKRAKKTEKRSQSGSLSLKEMMSQFK